MLLASLAATLLILISGAYLRSVFVSMSAYGSPRRRVLVRSCLAVFAMCAAISLGGCGGYSAPSNPNETPPGIFTIDISATAQNASRAITLTVNVD